MTGGLTAGVGGRRARRAASAVLVELVGLKHHLPRGPAAPQGRQIGGPA
jgi:hypothetical protein